MAEDIGPSCSTTPPFPPRSLSQHSLSDPPPHALTDPALLSPHPAAPPPVDPSIDVQQQHHQQHAHPSSSSPPPPATPQHQQHQQQQQLHLHHHRSLNSLHLNSLHPPPPQQQQQQHSHEPFDMQPPPESSHASFAALHAFAQSHAAAHGYALSINTTAKNRARVKLACVCYGAPKNTHHLTDETRVRKKRQSSKTGCRMWVEGKRMNDGTWVLKVGEPTHNHEGRSVEEWAVHRRRTWGLGGGGGGIVAGAVPAGQLAVEQLGDVGETVWRIVEEEMERGGGGGGASVSLGGASMSGSGSNNGGGGSGGALDDGSSRDRGVGRTVRVLQEKLPGIRIFKRDVYNIRAQIKKARKQQADPDGAPDDDDEGRALADAADADAFGANHDDEADAAQHYPDIDPALVAQYSAPDREASAPSSMPPPDAAGQDQQHAAPTATMGGAGEVVAVSGLASSSSFSPDQSATEQVLQLRGEVDRLMAETQRLRAESATEIQRLTAAVARLEAEKNEAAIETQKMKIENEQLKLQVLFSNSRRTSTS